jgi:uncharacterized membrane protein YfhO
VSCPATRFLVVNSTYFPGWQAEIDGRPAEIVRANALAHGVVVPPGTHRVRLAYRPGSFRLGLAVSLVAAVGAGAGALVKRRRRSP